MKVIYDLYIRFMIFLGAAPPAEYEKPQRVRNTAGKQTPQEKRRIPGWYRIGYVIIIALAFLMIIALGLSWVRDQVPLGDEFTLELVSEESRPEEIVYDVVENREYRLTYGLPPTLQVSLQPTGTAWVSLLKGQSKVFSRTGSFFTFSLSDLITNTSPATGTYHILAEGPWGSWRDLPLIYRPRSPFFLDDAYPFTRTLSATLFSNYSQLRYRLTLPADTAARQPAVIDLRQGRIGMPVFLKWTYYSGKNEFTGREFANLEGPKYHLTDNELTIEISATIRGNKKHLSNLNQLLETSQALGPVPLEIQTEAVKIASANPWPDVITNSHWLWQRGPVTVSLNLSQSIISTEAPISFGLIRIREKLDDLGRVLTIMLVLSLPLLPFAWWALLTKQGVTARIPAWPIWLGAMFWLAPLIIFVVHSTSKAMVSLAMVSSSLALGVLALGFPVKRQWRLLSAGAAVLATPVAALGVQYGLRDSLFVAIAGSLALLGVLRLIVRSVWPDHSISKLVWLLIWAPIILLTYPVPIPAFGFTETIGWPLEVQLWPSFLLILGLYVLPYVVLAMTLRLLRDREEELAAKPSHLLAVGKFVFVFFLVGGTRGLTPGSGSLPPVYPVAFVLALLLYHWLVPQGKAYLQGSARRRKEILQRRADLIQAALDIQWARKALDQLLQGDDLDPQIYEKEKTQLEKYLTQRQSVVDSCQAEGPSKAETAPASELEPKKVVFACGPYASAWENGLLGGKRALFIGCLVIDDLLTARW